MRQTIVFSLLILFFWVGANGAFALDPVFSRGGAAIRGYDPVAYFLDGKPRKGKRAHTAFWNGATWRFYRDENRILFLENPEKYAPQYGGYCAWAVSQGYTASIDPDAWTIFRGKLYLNYSKGVRVQWEGDKAGNVSSGDRNWPKLLGR